MIHDKKPKSDKNIKTERHLGTAGAISQLNTEGKWCTVKVKTQRYISGKVPEFSGQTNQFEYSNSDEDEIITDNLNKVDSSQPNNLGQPDAFINIPQNFEITNDEPSNCDVQPLKQSQLKQSVDNAEKVVINHSTSRANRAKLLLKQQDELFAKDSNASRAENAKAGISDDSNEEESSEYEDSDYTDSDDEKIRLKPVYVREQDRLTIKQKQQAEKQALESKQMQNEAAKINKNRILNIIDKEFNNDSGSLIVDDINNLIMELQIADENEDDEMEYQLWKVRELERIKRYKEEAELRRQETEEIRKIRDMSEEKRLDYMIKNPKIITNAAEKGKYDYLQKYYHRGVFYLGKEDELVKRNIDAATEEDNFDRTKLPKVMQVRDFGKASRTKYTHLVDEDTNDYLNPLKNKDLLSQLHTKHSGGMKQNFEKPSAKRKKK